MSATILATVQKELGAPASRDLTALVKQVKVILPQFSDDAVCEALVQVDEDVSRAVECLLSRPPPVKKAGKKKKEPAPGSGPSPAASPALAPSSPPSGPATSPGGGGGAAAARDRSYSGNGHPRNDKDDEPAEDDRPKTAADKETQKQRKKLRDIERIEEKLARGEKVDPLQLPKLEKKNEVEAALAAAEQIVQQEAVAREQARRREEEERREECLRREREIRSQLAQPNAAAARPPSQPQQPPRQAAARQGGGDPETSAHWHPTVHQGKDEASRHRPQETKKSAAGNELLSMLHANKQDQSQVAYQQTADLARQLGGGVMPRQFGSQQQPHDVAQQQRRPQQSRQGYTHNPRHNGDHDLINEYSTPLDEHRFTPEQRAAAERIAAEIEQQGSRSEESSKGGRGWHDGAKGYSGGKGGGGRSSYHGGKGKKGSGDRSNRWRN